MPKISRLTARVDGCALAVRVVAAPAADARGTVFVPPLIGGSGMQQVAYFRDLNRAGYAIATFDYRGHGKSEGRFTIGTSLTDAVAVARELAASSVPRPLLGLGDCYAAIPLLIAAGALPSTFRALALVNAIPSLRHVITPLGLLGNYLREGGRWRPRNPFDWKGMLAATNAQLFPDVDKSRDHFGILSYDDARGWRTFWEYATLDPLAGLSLDTPSIVAYGTSDRILGLDSDATEAAYTRTWLRILPRAELHPLADIDHFFSTTLRVANEVPRAFFERVAAGEARLRTVSVSPVSARSGTTSSVA